MTFIDKVMMKMGWVRYHRPVSSTNSFGVVIGWLDGNQEVLATYEPQSNMEVGDSITVDILPTLTLARPDGKVTIYPKALDGIEEAYDKSVEEFLKKIKYMKLMTKVR